MLSADISILYVSNVMKSSNFYAQLFDINPVEKSPTFALFIFENGFKLGLWSSYTVEPSVNQIANIPSGEIVFTVQNKPEIDALYQAWGTQHQVTVIQKPAQLLRDPHKSALINQHHILVGFGEVIKYGTERRSFYN